MGLKRRNPARTRLFNVSDVMIVKSASASTRSMPVVEEASTATKAIATAPVEKPARQPPSHEERHQMIAKVAYGRAERGGFSTDPLFDWLAAEREVDAMIANAPS